MNKVIISGRIAKDLTLRYTTNNKAVMTFSLAIQRTKTEADFIQVVAYGKNAELLDKYCKKGYSLTVAGQLRTRNYDDKDGKRVFVTEVIAEDIEFGTKAKDPQEETNEMPNEIPQEFIDEDLPF